MAVYTIEKNERISEAAEIYRLAFKAPDITSKATAGQIIHIVCGGDSNSLRRPISICECDGESVVICFEVRGVGTRELASRGAGDLIDVIGPYGNGFPALSGKVALVGGGIGIYPLISAAKAVKAAGGVPTALLGFRNKSLMNMTDTFEKYCADVMIATDDGSYGRHGFVTAVLEEYLDENPDATVLVCGPRGMMAAVSGISLKKGNECYVSMEERMGCGVGACLACVCKTQFVGNEGRGEKYKRVCVDGPVFNAKEIIWE